jgi:hypothetical protein
MTNLGGGHRGVLDVWQGKDLREGHFGSVAIAGLTGEILDLWQVKELEESRAAEQAGKGIMEFGTLWLDWLLTIKNHVTMKYRTCQDKLLSG